MGLTYAEMRTKLKDKGMNVGEVFFDKYLVVVFTTVIQPGSLAKVLRGLQGSISANVNVVAGKFRALINKIKEDEPKSKKMSQNIQLLCKF